MKSLARRHTGGLWKGLCEAWKASGITKQAYCEQKGISYRSFVCQHNRLMSQSNKAPLNFIETKPESAVLSSHAAGLQLMLPNGICIGIGAEINPVLLQNDTPRGEYGVYFDTTNEDRIQIMSVPLIGVDDIISLPKGQAMALVNGREIYKIRIPLAISDPAILNDIKLVIRKINIQAHKSKDELQARFYK